MNSLPNIQLGPVDWVILILGLALRARAVAKRNLSR